MPAEFHFLRPAWLWLLLPLALLAWRLLRSRGDAAAWHGLVDPHLLPQLLVDGGGRVWAKPAWLLALGWLLLVLALAGPAWQRLPQPVYQAQQYRVILLDLSPSMNAADVAPSRLAQARFEVLDLLRRSSEGQVALIAFGPEPFVVSPLTSDIDTITGQVPSLETALLPVPGERRLGMALDEARELLQQAGAPDGEVILVTDAVIDPGAAVAAANRLSSAGYRLSVLGVGTPEGAPVPLQQGGFQAGPRAAQQVAKLDRGRLRTLAAAGGGVYVRARVGEADLDAILSGPAAAGLTLGSEGENATSDQWREEGPWLLLALLPLAALAFRRGWLGPLLVLVVVAPAPPAQALSWDDLWSRADQQALRALEQGEAARAAEQFERQDWRAAALYRAGRYEQSLQALEQQSGPRVDYNQGNALARLGRLEEALKAYQRALQADPADQDAQHNYDLVKDLLAQQAQGERENPERQQNADMSMSSDDQQQPQSGEQSSQSDGEGQESEQPSQSGEQTSDQQQAGANGDQEGDGQDSEGDSEGDSDQGGSESGDKDGESGEQSADQAPGQTGQAGRESAGDRSANRREAGQPGGDQDREQQAAAQGQSAEQQPPEQQAPQQPAAGGQDARQRDLKQGEGGDEPDASDLLAHTGRGGHDQQQPDDSAQGDRERTEANLNGGSGGPTSELARQSRIDLEGTQRMEQMLRSVEDDPAGLLRQRFLLQHLRRAGKLP